MNRKIMPKNEHFSDISAFDALESLIKTRVEFSLAAKALIRTKLKYRSFLKGDFILETGQTCNFWAIVTTGLVRVFSYTATGKEYSNWFVKEDELLTEFVSFFDKTTASLENMVALEDTTIVYFELEILESIMREIPEFDKFCRLIYQSKLIEMKRNILHRIHYEAKERYLFFTENHPELLRRVPLKFIASFLNMTDSSLSRIRKKIVAPAEI